MLSPFCHAAGDLLTLISYEARSYVRFKKQRVRVQEERVEIVPILSAAVDMLCACA